MKQKRSYCFVCGEEIGLKGLFSDRLDTCEKVECTKAARYECIEDRLEAHERLDRDMDW